MPTPTCANPLLLEWIKEIYDQARERNTKGVTTQVNLPSYRHKDYQLTKSDISVLMNL